MCESDDDQKIVPIAEAMEKGYVALKRGNQGSIGIGLQTVDEACGLMGPGELIIIAGRPGQGKTTLGMQAAIHSAYEKGRSVLFASLEMSHASLGGRTMCALAGLDPRLLRRGKPLSKRANDSVLEVLNAMTDVKLSVWDASRATVAQIQAKAKHH